MRTMLSISLIALTFLVSDSTARADQESHRRAAEELLKTLQVDSQLKTTVDQMLDLQIKTNPQIAPYRDAMKRFLSKHMSWDSLKDEMITIYAEAFTEDELNQVTSFYKTPAGKKMIQKMPELMSKGMQLGVKRVQENQSELSRMIEDERSKNQNQKPQ